MGWVRSKARGLWGQLAELWMWVRGRHGLGVGKEAAEGRTENCRLVGHTAAFDSCLRRGILERLPRAFGANHTLSGLSYGQA